MLSKIAESDTSLGTKELEVMAEEKSHNEKAAPKSHELSPVSRQRSPSNNLRNESANRDLVLGTTEQYVKCFCILELKSESY